MEQSNIKEIDQAKAAENIQAVMAGFRRATVAALRSSTILSSPTGAALRRQIRFRPNPTAVEELVAKGVSFTGIRPMSREEMDAVVDAGVYRERARSAGKTAELTGANDFTTLDAICGEAKAKLDEGAYATNTRLAEIMGGSATIVDADGVGEGGPKKV